MNLSDWNKLVLLFLAVSVLIILGKYINLDSFLGLKQKTIINNPIQTSSPVPTTITPSITTVPTIISSPTPILIKTIQRVKTREFENDN